jgi:hypothetical protein
MHFIVFVGVVVLMPEYVMRYPFYWALLKHRPGGGDQVKMRRRRFNDKVDVCTIKESGETVATKVNGPGSDAMEPAELAYHGSNAKEPCHFTAVHTLIGRPGTMFTPLYRLFLDAASNGISAPVHRSTLDSASVAQAEVPYWSLEEPTPTDTHLPFRIASAIAEPSSVMSTCITAQLVAGTRRESRSWRVCLAEVASALLGLFPVSHKR